MRYPATLTMAEHETATAIHAVPAEPMARGFRLLCLRQFAEAGTPPAFAFIDQHILRPPQRSTRHGVFFSATFRPEIMAWLSARLGRPTLHDDAGAPQRNPRWPTFVWRGENRRWPDGIDTIEWHVEVIFTEDETATAFQQAWRENLAGRPATNQAGDRQ